MPRCRAPHANPHSLQARLSARLPYRAATPPYKSTTRDFQKLGFRPFVVKVWHATHLHLEESRAAYKGTCHTNTAFEECQRQKSRSGRPKVTAVVGRSWPHLQALQCLLTLLETCNSSNEASIKSLALFGRLIFVRLFYATSKICWSYIILCESRWIYR